MALDDQEEYEQGEQLRQWLRTNGMSMIGGIAIGLALIAGWQWWQRRELLHQQNVAATYAAFTAAYDAGADAKALDAAVRQVRAASVGTPYTALAALRMAAFQLGRGDAKGALASLDGVGKVAKDPALTELVQLRAARVLVILDRPNEALRRLDAVKNDAWIPVADEIRGDAQRALGNTDAARTAYASALAKLPDDAPGRNLLAMKLTEVGGVIPQSEAKKA
ncbi:MAG: tetratricopeptide repeat protein [Proteobacteria bacterium]|nr:tetratricopeptide repeat protein [Pseudomonadota bacterium]